MRHFIVCLLVVWTCPLVAQPAKIKFIVGAELSTEMTSVTDLHVITSKGAYNFNEIRTISFWNEAPDSATVNLLRYNGIGIYLKNKYLKPLSVKSARAWDAKVKGRADTTALSDSIRIDRNRYWRGSVRLNKRDVLSILQGNPASHAEATQARSNYNAAQLVGFVGGFLIGWPLGQAIGGKQEPQWGLAAGGTAILLGVGIPLSIGFKKHTERAIKIYNGKTPVTGGSGVSIQFFPGVNGGTLLVKF